MKTGPWKNLVLISMVAAGLYAFMEWLFIVTMPSFLSALPWPQRINILLFTFSLLTTLCLLALAPLALLGRLESLRARAPLLIRVGVLVPASVLATLSLLMLDNFTYTVFKFGIVSTRGVFRGLYGALFVVLLAAWSRYTLTRLEWLGARIPVVAGWKRRLISGVILAAVLPAGLTLLQSGVMPPLGVQTARAAGNLPHILIITADGLEANHLPVYGYERDTSPNLRRLAGSALIAENAFANAGNSTGSVISLYTSRYATQTRVVYPPDILRGVDSYRHLPGILRSLGYRTAQFAVNHYVDAVDQNVINAFDIINNRDQVSSPALTFLNTHLPPNEAYFVVTLFNRLDDRLEHIFYIKEMANPFEQVTNDRKSLPELATIHRLLGALHASDQPLFAHVHMMVTHGPGFEIKRQVFSAGQTLEGHPGWADDFYDDAILEFDRHIGMVLDDLQETGLLDNTIVIIGSDHGRRWDVTQRLPLVIRFPEGRHAGKISANVQNLDIAPTLLDYLNVRRPAWMQGQSLLALKNSSRPIFSVNALGGPIPMQQSGTEVDWQQIAPPFYQFYAVTAVYCQKWYTLGLAQPFWNSGKVPGHTAPCPASELPSDEQAFAALVKHLMAAGFDTSSLTWPLAAPVRH